MTRNWTPPSSQHPPPHQPGGGAGGNGLIYALIGLAAVLAVVVGVVAVMALGGDGSSDAVAEGTEQQAPPAPAAGEGAKPRPTQGAPARETVTETETETETERQRDAESGRTVWGTGAVHQFCANGAVTGTSSTSCPFAKNVTDAVWREDIGARHLTVRVYSPATKETYSMACTLGSMSGHDATYRCTGGSNAVVFVGVAG